MEAEKNKNINRGYRKLQVWQEAVELYVFISELLSHLPYEYKKSAANAIDASLSIQRNISEGYCRRSSKEYLNFLNYSLGSCGELYTSIYSFKEAGIISHVQFENFDDRHYKLENKLINLIKSIQKKQKDNAWEMEF